MRTKFKNIKLFFAVMFTSITVWFAADYAVFGLKEIGVEVERGFAEEASAATYYIDPDCANNGDGNNYTCASSSGGQGAWNTWAFGSLTSGSTYLQKAGSIWNSTENRGVGTANIIFGSYDPSNGLETMERAIIKSSQSDGIIFRVFSPNVQIKNFEIYHDGTLDRTSTRCAVRFNGSTNGVTNSILSNCVLHNLRYGVRGINNADGFKIEDCEIYDIWSDGLYIHGNDVEISNCTIYNVDKEENAGDAIQFTTSANNAHIHHCNITRETSSKQCLILNAIGSNALIEYNEFKKSGSTGVTCIWNNIDNTTVQYNIFHGSLNYGTYLVNEVATAIIRNNTYYGCDKSISTHYQNVEVYNNAIINSGNYSISHGYGTFNYYNNDLYGGIINGSPTDGGNNIASDPFFLNISGSMNESTDFQLSWNSPLIDTGTSVSLTTDYAGNPIYGTPDIGAYEYQPPYFMGTDHPDIGANVRVYGDSKFRNKNTPSGTMANIEITPLNSDTAKWLDITIDTWHKSGDYKKKWTEFSNTIGNSTVAHTIGDLLASQTYDIYYTKNDGSRTKLSAKQADSSGKIIFNYDQGYSDITFEIEEDTDALDTTPPTGSISINNGDATTNSQNTNLSISVSDSSGVTEMKISNTNDFSSAVIETYNTVKSWALSTGDGLKTVYVWFKDTIGNWNTTPYTDTITLDTSGDDGGGGGGGTVSDTTPPLIFNITILNITTASVQINFTTNELTTSYIEYGLTASYSMRTETNSSRIMNYESRIMNLSDNTAYHYRITSTDEAGNTSRSTDQTFITGEPTIPNPSFPYPNGSLLKTQDDDKIYFIVNNQRRWITSIEVFLSYGLTPNTEIVVDSSILDQYSLGADLNVSSLQEGTLIRGKNTYQVYIIKPPYKRHIFNPDIFDMYQHFDWNSIEEIEADIADSYITSDLYRSLNDYRVYSLEEIDEVLGKAVKHHLNMTSQRFIEKGYNWNQVFMVNDEERDYYETGGDEG